MHIIWVVHDEALDDLHDEVLDEVLDEVHHEVEVLDVEIEY